MAQSFAEAESDLARLFGGLLAVKEFSERIPSLQDQAQVIALTNNIKRRLARSKSDNADKPLGKCL